jgi:transcriptional regulator with XRE-family HTH domain
MLVNLARQLYHTRKASLFTVKRLSNKSGVCIKTIKAVERGRILKVEISELVKIANALGVVLQIKIVSVSEMLKDEISNYTVPSFEEEMFNKET